MASKKRGRGWYIAAGVFAGLGVLMGFLVVIIILVGIPADYHEARGLVVVGGINTIIRFEVDGEEVQFDAAFEAVEGEHYTVYYDPGDPAGTAETQEGHADTVRWGWYITAFFFVVAALLAGIGALRARSVNPRTR